MLADIYGCKELEKMLQRNHPVNHAGKGASGRFTRRARMTTHFPLMRLASGLDMNPNRIAGGNVTKQIEGKAPMMTFLFSAEESTKFSRHYNHAA